MAPTFNMLGYHAANFLQKQPRKNYEFEEYYGRGDFG